MTTSLYHNLNKMPLWLLLNQPLSILIEYCDAKPKALGRSILKAHLNLNSSIA